MRRIYLSFLGLGSYKKDKKASEYDPAIYELNGRKSEKTEFVQVAEIELLGASSFDVLIIVATKKSHETHFNCLEKQLLDRGASGIFPIIIDEDMTAEGQWKWFEKILNHIQFEDELTIDLTHGYRSIPIVFSTAINFLQKAKNITLKAVYYGVFEKLRTEGFAPIIDMKEFYIINEWAEGVSRLVEDADARKLASVAESTSQFQAGDLNDPEVSKAFQDLTHTIRNVDINRVAEKANAAIALIREKEEKASTTGKILLNLVINKFASLTTEEPPTGRYDAQYFDLQIEIIRILLEHKLYMQAYTVMREFIGSIGMIEVKKAKVSSSDGRNRRKRYAEVFVNMFQFSEARWEFGGDLALVKENLTPYYNKLKEIGVESRLRSFTEKLAEYRNGFDHAWTRKAEVPKDIEETGKTVMNELQETILILKEYHILT